MIKTLDLVAHQVHHEEETVRDGGDVVELVPLGGAEANVGFHRIAQVVLRIQETPLIQSKITLISANHYGGKELHDSDEELEVATATGHDNQGWNKGQRGHLGKYLNENEMIPTCSQ